MTVRLIPPENAVNSASITVNGRSYICSVGSTIDVPDGDALVMRANGWTASATGGVGATSARPTNPKKGQTFHDTSLNINIIFDDKVWRNPNTGAAV